MPIRSQDTITGWDFRADGKVLGAFQQAPPCYTQIRLDMEEDELSLFRTVSNRGSPEGRSLFRNAWRSWHFLKRIQEIEAIGCEKDLVGMLVFELPMEYFAANATADQKQTVDNWLEIGERVRRGEHECLVLPAVEQTGSAGTLLKSGYKASLLQSGGRRPIDVNEIIKRLESRIAISFLGEGALLGMQGTAGASRSLASSKTEAFALTIGAVQTSEADIINRRVIPRLVRANGWPLTACPTYKPGDIESDDSSELAASIANLVNAGIMRADEGLDTYMRTRMGLPLHEDVSVGQVQDALGSTVEAEKDMTPEAQRLSAEMAAEAAVPIAGEAGSPSQTLTAEEAAQVLGVSRSVINRAISSGKLPGAKVGASYRVFRQDLFDHMKGPAARAS